MVLGQGQPCRLVMSDGTGEVKDVLDTASIDGSRKAICAKRCAKYQFCYFCAIGYAQKHAKVTKSMPCAYFYQGSCMQKNPHAEIDCKNKNKENF